MNYPRLAALCSLAADSARSIRLFTRTRWFRAGLPALLAVSFSVWNLKCSDPGMFYWDLQRFSHGGFFLAGVSGVVVTSNMPLFEIVVAVMTHLGATFWHFFILLHLGVYSLVFLAGCLFSGYWTGIISLAMAGLIGVEKGIVYEQTFYSFFLLLVLIFLLLKSRGNTLKNSLFCGLAVGASLLIRTPLLFFPPLVVFADWLYSRERSRAFILRSLVFLSASYVLLLPWGFLNHSLNGTFNVFDTSRSACPTITAAKGSIFTMEGDCRKLAGLGPEDSAIGFYLREWSKAPVFHFITVLRRLWAIFLFYPELFLFFLAALAFGRWRDKPLLIVFPLYFILIHALLSIEMCYFSPLRYLLVPLIAGALMSRLAPEAAPCRFAAKGAAAAFWLTFCVILGTEALITAYPFRIAGPETGEDVYARASARFPRDAALHVLKCRELWSKGDDAGFRECLSRRTSGLEDISGSYFAAVSASLFPSKILFPVANEHYKSYLECLIVRMLREFELGQRTLAMASLREAYGVFERNHNKLQGKGFSGNIKLDLTYERDKQLGAMIRADSDRFWDTYVYEMLLFWPPQRMAVILSELGESAPLTGRLKTLLKELTQGRVRGDTRDLILRAQLSLWPTAPLSVRSEAGSALTARPLPGRGSQNTLLDQCRALAAENKKEQALTACQEAVYSASSAGSGPESDSARTACDASFESYKLLKAMGREEEAAEVLFWAVGNAPSDWAGLPEARRALAGR